MQFIVDGISTTKPKEKIKIPILKKSKQEVVHKEPPKVPNHVVTPEAFMLSGIIKNSAGNRMIIDVIKESVCAVTDYEWHEILNRTRKREIVEARQLMHYFLKKHTRLSLSAIGRMVGSKDHATVLHSVRVVNNLYETDKEKRNITNQISDMIQQKLLGMGTFTRVQVVQADTIADWNKVKHKYIN